MTTDAFARAVDALGGKDAFIEAAGISPRTFQNWKRDGVPDTRWPEIAALTAGAVSVIDLAKQRAAVLTQGAG